MEAARLARSWAATGRHVAQLARQRALRLARTAFDAELARLKTRFPDLLHAYVADEVARALEGYARALDAHLGATDEEDTKPGGKGWW